MKHLALVPLLSLVGACAAPPPAAIEPLQQPQSEPQQVVDGLPTAKIRSDVEGSVREGFGDGTFQRAIAAEASVMAKLYQGLPPPPVQQPDGSWKYPDPPLAVVLRENGRWYRADAAGVRAVQPAVAAEIEQLLASPQLWAEAERVAQGGCTDGGSSLLVIRYPGRGNTVRQGTCGGPPLSYQLLGAVMRA